jgi:nucleotide-binding universal stress UspA family protein
MSFANVMVYVDPQQQEEGQIRVAEAIAGRFGGAVIGVSAFAVEPPFVAEGVIIVETTEEEVKRIKAALAAKEAWFRKIVSLPSEKVEWRWGVEYPTTFLVRQARAADLVVVKRKQLKQDEYQYIDSAAAMLIVTGGYGHSRLGEWIFGGMTSGLLQEAPVCLMMSH